jgi:endonuclease/exonuclease/phosphatase family metal-dependent hydrolase
VVAFDQYVLASRYPLQDCRSASLGTGTRPGSYLHCGVRIGAQEVQLVTAHFVSPRSSLLATRSELVDGLQDWQANLAKRLTQSQTLFSALGQMSRPLVVMGDFNAPEASPVVANLKRAGLVDAFAEGGKGWGYTHGHALSQHLDLYRIDHILVSAGVHVQSAEVGSSDASEHNPVVADVLIRPQ